MPHYQTKKRFGQHFLHDISVIHNIILSIAPKVDQQLIEIGPGLGALTFPLLEKSKTLDVIEIDRDIIQFFHNKNDPRITVHAMDALKVEPHTLQKSSQPLRIVGNLPYNISTPLIFHLLKTPELIQDMHFMLQKEVVDRITANPSSKRYGRLSIMVQYACQTEYLFPVGPEAFKPPPKVDSAVVRLIPWQTKPYIAHNFTAFAAMVNQAFQKRRKSLRNALKGHIELHHIEQANINPSLRPENLSVADFVMLSNIASAPS